MNFTHFELATHLQISVQFDDWLAVAKDIEWAHGKGMQVGTYITDGKARSTLHISVSTPNHSAAQSISGLTHELADDLQQNLVKRGAMVVAQEAKP